MSKSIPYLLPVVLAVSSIMIAVSSPAQTVIKSDSQVTDTINPISSEQITATETTSTIGNPASSATKPAPNSTNRDQVVVSETDSKVSDSSSPVAGRIDSSNQRVPLFSRIFAAPSMQQ